ncbi:MAG: discoidin domain-containing protein [Proteobacteria bacterium]|nr:discoidin domain-containing protein [Pseudomonadota bacterium]
MRANSATFTIALCATLFSTTAFAGQIKVAGAMASSTYAPQEGATYDAAHAIDGKHGKSWVEGEDGSGLGSWIELDLGGSQDVTRIKMWAGDWYSTDYWRRANRPKEVELSFSDGTKQTWKLDDAQEVQVLDLASPKSTSSIRFKVKGIHSGSTWLDTVISEIQVFDASGDGPVVREVTASTELPADGDGNYNPSNVADGIKDSMWCEGDDGDGSGQSLDFAFGASTRISKLSLINGIGGSMPLWMKANRAVGGTLTFSDGSTESIVIKNSMMPQVIPFSAKTTTSVKLTFTEVKAGKEYNDLCISEATFGG